MSQRRRLEQRLAGMSEIGEIMRSMKNLAFMEARKLERLIVNQKALVERIERVAADFLAFRPEVLPQVEPAHRIFLVVGSRRGFCGDFNQRLYSRWLAETEGVVGLSATIAVGQKLGQHFPGKSANVRCLEGADLAEEIPPLLAAVVKELVAQQAKQEVIALTVLWHEEPAAEPSVAHLLPPFEDYREPVPTHGVTPLLNLEPRDFLLGLVEQYLFAALHGVFYESLMAENAQRVRHLDGAVRHLEERSEALRRRARALRQEEIIEEIEVILLNATGPEETADSTPTNKRQER